MSELDEQPLWWLAAIRKAPRLSAVIRRDSRGVVVELSDGRRRCLHAQDWPLHDYAVDAAVHWARRHGVAAVRVEDSLDQPQGEALEV
jgi:hypothetical protein